MVCDGLERKCWCRKVMGKRMVIHLVRLLYDLNCRLNHLRSQTSTVSRQLLNIMFSNFAAPPPFPSVLPLSFHPPKLPSPNLRIDNPISTILPQVTTKESATTTSTTTLRISLRGFNSFLTLDDNSRGSGEKIDTLAVWHGWC